MRRSEHGDSDPSYQLHLLPHRTYYPLRPLGSRTHQSRHHTRGSREHTVCCGYAPESARTGGVQDRLVMAVKIYS